MNKTANSGAIARLRTEQSNLASAGLDNKSALEIAQIINQADATVAAAVGKALPQIARSIDIIADSLANGGRPIYSSAGTSGRSAAPDAWGWRRTFSTEPTT